MSDSILLVLYIGTLAVFITAASPAPAAEYFLAPNGDDNAAGSREAPWASLAKANSALEAGDTVTLLPGEYAGTISPTRSGEPDAPVTYRASEPWGARIVPGEAGPLISLDGHQHITIQGLVIDGRMQSNWGQVTGCRHLTISGCEMRRNPTTMRVFKSSQVRLTDNLFSSDRLQGDTLHLLDCNEVLFEGNSTTRVGHCPLCIHNCHNVAVRANIFRAEWGRNYTFWNSGRLLIEGNIITRARDSAGSADSIAKNLYDDSIFRHNLVFDNLHIPLNTFSYTWGGITPTSPLYRGPFVAMNSRFYHNTIVDNLGYGWWLGGINVSSHVFQNNIFYRNDYAGGGIQIVRAEGISRDNRFVSNLLGNGEPGKPVVQYGSQFWTAEEANANTATVGEFWSEFHGNIDVDPAFVDAANRDYRLTADSPAIDAGTPLALAMGAGTGRELPVTDGRWFYDGFGIDGEEGDLIAIGSGDNIAQIERVELRYYQPAILHLDREVTWQDGMPVSLPWSGAAPDLGAFEHGSHPSRLLALARPAEVEPGDTVHFSLDSQGKQVASVLWDFEDGSFSSDMKPLHSFAQSGHYGVTARVVFEDGRRGIAAVFVHVPERLDLQAPLVEVDFEDASREISWGYHFKFYRGHQTSAEHVARPDGEGKCMRIYYDPAKANSTAAQIAPGMWDMDRYPVVRFDYRIPAGVPVAVEVTPFAAAGVPGGFTLGGTEERPSRYEDLGICELVADGQWHTISLDVRRVREICPELRYLRQFMFYTNWREDAGQEMWFDEFAILPE
ncbi:MAG: hypothetical protein GX358_07410 [candidate division WS1 bacterium]|nr:hypothetical protein [candidate division WS1 bacterium]